MKISGEEAIKILKELKESAKTIDAYEDDIFEDYRNMAKYEMREMVETLLKLDL